MSNITESLNNFWNGAVKPIVQKLSAEATQATAALPTTGWTKDANDISGYPWHYDLSVTGLTANDLVTVCVQQGSQTAAVACGLCPVNDTRTGAIRFFAAAAPGSAINIAYHIKKK